MRWTHIKTAPMRGSIFCYKLFACCHKAGDEPTEFGLSTTYVTECDTMSEYKKLMTFAPIHRCSPPRAMPAATGVEGRIAAFLAGKSDGGELLHALYDYVLDEPIPPSMRALLGE
jgi:hypothetical protein